MTPPPPAAMTSPHDASGAVRTTQLKIAALVGLAAGALGGLFGVGGGLIIVPGLVLVAKLERRLAHGTSLAATLPIAIASMTTYGLGGHIDWAVAPLLAIGAMAGAVVGTKLLTVLPTRVLTIIFIITVLATAVRLLLSSDTAGRGDITVATVVLLVVVGFCTGILSGLLGIGGGIVMVPAMVVLLTMVPVMAKGTSVAVIVPTAIVGTLRNRVGSNVDLPIAAVTGVCGTVTAVIGGLVASNLSDGLSNAMFAGLLLFVACTQFATLRADSKLDSVD